MFRQLALLVPLGIAVWCSSAYAALEVSIGSVDLLPGQTAQIPVLIRSDAADVLDIFSLEIRISGTGVGVLKFVAVPPFNQAADPHLGTSDYLFHGDSTAELVPPAGIIKRTVYDNDTYLGGDGTLTGNGIIVPSSFTLLTILEVTANTTGPAVLGNEFTLELVPGPNTYFWSPSPAYAEIPYTASSGTVSVVPEPNLITFLLPTAIGIPIAMRRRPRSQRTKRIG